MLKNVTNFEETSDTLSTLLHISKGNFAKTYPSNRTSLLSITSASARASSLFMCPT